jgi:hypothetical protein
VGGHAAAARQPNSAHARFYIRTESDSPLFRSDIPMSWPQYKLFAWALGAAAEGGPPWGDTPQLLDNPAVLTAEDIAELKPDVRVIDVREQVRPRSVF